MMLLLFTSTPARCCNHRWIDRWTDIKGRVEELERKSGSRNTISADATPRGMLGYLKDKKANMGKAGKKAGRETGNLLVDTKVALDEAAKLHAKKIKKRHKKTVNEIEAGVDNAKKSVEKTARKAKRGILKAFVGVGIGLGLHKEGKKKGKGKKKM